MNLTAIVLQTRAVIFYIIYGNYGQIKLKIHYICNNKCLLTKNNKRKKGDMTLEELVRQT